MGYARVTGVYDVGDPRTATLLISTGGDGTTGAVLTITRPDATGSTFTPAVQTTDGGTNWRTSSPYTLTLAGDWVESWTITGKGAGTEGQVVAVPGTPPVSMVGVYATPGQYAGFVGGTMPANLVRLLRRASQDVDDALLTSVYDPTDAVVLLALAEATCEQVADWLDKGWLNGAPLPYSDVKIGTAQVSGLIGGSPRSGGTAISDGKRLCPRAMTVLQRQGLTGQPPNTQASWFWG